MIPIRVGQTIKRIDSQFCLLVLGFVGGISMTQADSTSLHGVGKLKARMGVLSVNAKVIQGLLPESMELAPQPFARPGNHPVLIGFGLQKNVHPKVGDHDLPPVTSDSYLETAIIIPYVKYRGSFANGDFRNGPFMYMPILYLDDLRAVWAGKAYGFPKKHEGMQETADGYLISSLKTSRPLALAQFMSASGLGSEFDRNFDSVTKMLNQPIIGTNLLGMVCSSYNWNFAAAKVKPARMNFKLFEDFLPGLTPREESLNGIDLSLWGAFQIESHWTLTRPYSCKNWFNHH